MSLVNPPKGVMHKEIKRVVDVIKKGQIIAMEEVDQEGYLYRGGLAVVRFEPENIKKIKVRLPELDKFQYDYHGKEFQVVDTEVEVWEQMTRVYEQPWADDDYREILKINPHIIDEQYGRIKPIQKDKSGLEKKLDFEICTKPLRYTEYN